MRSAPERAYLGVISGAFLAFGSVVLAGQTLQRTPMGDSHPVEAKLERSDLKSEVVEDRKDEGQTAGDGGMGDQESGGVGGVSPLAVPGSTFVNWETPQVHPITVTPDGAKLLVVNTADNRLDIFSLESGASRPRLLGSTPVGLDPVSVRARSNSEAWVVNHISDSVSIVDLTTQRVSRTIKTGDEPCDVVFAGGGGPQRAFVSCSQINTVQVFDPANLDAAPTSIVINGEDPRAMSVSPDATKVYVAVFESGNGTTILGGGAASGRVAFPPNVVSDASGPYAGDNPPPNSGMTFSPGLNGANNPLKLPVGLIVRKNAAGEWWDDNAHNWTPFVSGPQAALSGRLPGWTLGDRDLAVISTSGLDVTYATGLMNICMAVGVNPATGAITVVGTEATNEVRYEPNVRGRFTRVKMASVAQSDLANKLIVDLNPHLTYAAATVIQSERDKSIGDPRAVEWNSTGTRGYIAGMGSNNVIVVGPSGARIGLAPTINVGEGPTGIALDEARGRMYVLNRFGASVSVVSLSTETEIARVPLVDPTPTAIRVGRKHLYDTHKTSGLGQLSCASCHVDARMDRLAWDLGDPSGSIQPLVDLNLGFGVPGLEPNSTAPLYQPFHPMKGPMTTQTLQDIIGKEPLHWRGDRAGLEAFNGAFVSLNGDDTMLTAGEMQEFENFLASIYFPPNPYRNFDNTLPTSVSLAGHYTTGRFAPAGQTLGAGGFGNAAAGFSIYKHPTRRLDGGVLQCVTCHTLPTGAGSDRKWNGSSYQPIALGPNGENHVGFVSMDGSTNITLKIPQLRNGYEKTGFNTTQLDNNAGFGYLHDGSIDSLERFVAEPIFAVNSDQEIADLVAFMLAFSGSNLPLPASNSLIQEPPGPASHDTHAAVGSQTTLRSASSPETGQLALIASMLSLADSGKVGVVAKGVRGGISRGWYYLGGGSFQSDRAGETISAAALQAGAASGAEITYTVVPLGSQVRIGVDRDMDGCFDRDYLERRCGPAACRADTDGSGSVDADDLFTYLDDWFAGNGQTCAPAHCPADYDWSTFVDADDLFAFLDDWFASNGTSCP